MVYFDEYDFLIGVGILCVFLPILWWKKRNLSYLLFFSIFWFYLLAVVQAVIFPFVVNTDYSNTIFTPSINLIPFYFGDCQIPELCIKSIFENIILTIPFGFGINFLVGIKPRNFLWFALAVGFGIEFSQLIISLVFRSAFRSVDINDTLLNGAGVLFGYALFRAFAWAYLKFADYFRIKYKWLFADIHDVVLQAQAIGKSKNA